MTRPLTLEFIGHSTVLIELDGLRILTDPVTRARVGPLRRRLEPPAAFVEYAAELAPDVRTLPTIVGDVVGWDA